MFSQTSEQLAAEAVSAEEEATMGSRNHSYVQACLTIGLARLNKFILFTELSLDIDGREYKPDVCAYPLEKDVKSLARDIVRVKDMPLLIIEILSPRQSVETIMEKFDACFRAGIQSCWMVIPSGHTVLVYASLDKVQSFSEGEITDEMLGGKIPLTDLFRQGHDSSPHFVKAASLAGPPAL
ncbi:MAG: Uma2 family endonuclease [Gammaproteobacteria bacterium]|nr:Uma2 family endonuclease [Gammaproteobacteria bacterium]